MSVDRGKTGRGGPAIGTARTALSGRWAITRTYRKSHVEQIWTAQAFGYVFGQQQL
jgi:hypothetical protein